MKNTLKLLMVVHFLLIFCLKGITQDSEYLIPINTNFSFKGYGSIDYKYGNLVNDDASFLNLKGGAVINSKFGFGLTGGAFLSEVRFKGLGSENLSTLLSPVMGYGGLFIEYIGLSSKKVHFSTPITLGPGIIALFEQINTNEFTEDENLVEFSSFFVIEPGINLEVNLIKEIKLCVGGSYRLVTASDLDRLENSDLSDFMFNVGIKISSY